MAAGIYNFTIEQGATLKRTFKYKDATGNALPLTGNTISMQIRDTVGSDDFILKIHETGATKFDNTDIITTKFTKNSTPDPLNEFHLVIDADTTASMSFDTSVYDIEIKNTQNEVTRLLQGKIKLSKEVTR
jgi:hypothetical protein